MWKRQLNRCYEKETYVQKYFGKARLRLCSLSLSSGNMRKFDGDVDAVVPAHLKIGKVAVLLDCNVKFIKNLIADEQLDGFLLGKDTVVTVESVNRYRENHRVMSKKKAEGAKHRFGITGEHQPA